MRVTHYFHILFISPILNIVVWCGVVMLEHEGADYGGSCLVVPAVLRTLQSVQYSTVSYLLR